MMKKRKILTSLCLSLCVLTAVPTMMTSCGGGPVNLPAETETVTLPDMTDDREIPEDILATYAGKLEDAFSSNTPVAAEDLTYTLNDDGTAVTVTGYTGAEVVLILPQEIDGVPVTAIAEGAFEDMGNLRALYIPDSVEAVGFGALKGCKSMTTLRTPVVSV